MANQDLTSSVSPDIFLDSLCQSTSANQQDECPICRQAYGNTKEHGTVTTNCDHTFHLHCLRTWLESQAEWATCPMCRTKFFKRPEEQQQEAPGWEGLELAYDNMTRDRSYQLIYDQIVSRWNPASGDWGAVLVAILNSSADSPTTAAGFVFVGAVIKCFADYAEDRDADPERFEKIGDILTEHEANQFDCTIEQAYEEAGISDYVARARS